MRETTCCVDLMLLHIETNDLRHNTSVNAYIIFYLKITSKKAIVNASSFRIPILAIENSKLFASILAIDK